MADLYEINPPGAVSLIIRYCALVPFEEDCCSEAHVCSCAQDASGVSSHMVKKQKDMNGTNKLVSFCDNINSAQRARVTKAIEYKKLGSNSTNN